MQEKSNITLADIIRFLMEEKNVSLSKIEIETGVSKSYLSRLANGSRDNPSLQVLERLADFFNMDVSDLLNSELVIVDDTEDEQETNREISVDILFKEELDQTCRELWRNIQLYCERPVVKKEDIKLILRKIHDLRLLNKKLS